MSRSYNNFARIEGQSKIEAKIEIGKSETFCKVSVVRVKNQPHNSEPSSIITEWNQSLEVISYPLPNLMTGERINQT